MTQAQHGAGRHRGDTTASRRRAPLVLRRGVQVIAALVSATLLVAMGYYRHTYNSLDSGLHRVAVSGLGPSSSGGTLTHVDGKAQNLLIIGSDSRAGLTTAQAEQLHVGTGASVDGSTSTDTLMVVHVPADGSRATLISIPRDSYVAIPGQGMWKINAAYVDGYLHGTPGYQLGADPTEEQKQAAGLTSLIATIKNLTGLEIDHYAMVSFEGFYNIAKAIGGISVNLCHAVDDTAATNQAEGNGRVGSGFHMSAGHHDLTPVQSLEFVRQRHNILNSRGDDLGDLGREARQRYFLAAAFSKMESANTIVNPTKLSALIKAVQDTLTLDPTMQLTDLARQMSDLSSSKISGQTIPTEGSEDIQGPGVSLIVDPAKVKAWVSALLNPKAAAPSGPRTPSATTHSSAANPASSSSASVAPAAKGCIN